MLLWLVACAEEEEGKPALELSPSELDFGSVALGDSAELGFEIQNTGGGELSLLSVALIEGSEVAFSVEREDEGAIGAGAAQAVRVVFTPDEQEDFVGRIQVRADVGTAYVELAGSGGPSTADADGDGWSVADGDCDDGNASVHPGAEEVCDGADDDCDGELPADERDEDHDGWSSCEGDCDDAVPSIHPEADELCDDADSDCDGVSADREDLDGDGWSVCDDDCDDAEVAVHPEGEEVCDGLDNDCSGEPDDVDEDADGFSTCQGDCDDADPGVFPVYVSKEGSSAGDGSPERPFDTLADGLAAVVEDCPTVTVGEGRYEEALSWTGGSLQLVADGDVFWDPPAGERALEVLGGEVHIEGVTFEGGDPVGDGGAVRVDGARLLLSGCAFTGNLCTGDGGALAVSAGELWMEEVSFTDNVATDDGGALSVLSSTVEIAGCSFEGNRAVRGGAIQLDAANGLLQASSIVGNEASDQGGGVELIGGSDLLLEEIDLWSNLAGGRGGGLSVVDVAAEDVWVRRSALLDNEAGESGGGVAWSGSVAAGLFANNTLAGNLAAGGGAGVDVDVTDAAELFVWSNILYFNDGLVGLEAAGTLASVGYNHVYGSSSGVELSLGAAEDAGENEEENPELRAWTDDGDPGDDDLSLATGSPCRNSGPESGGPEAYDWRDDDGTRNDRGSTGGPQ